MTSNATCVFHESRINKIEDTQSDLKSDISRMDEKLDNLSATTDEGFIGLNRKIDKICAMSDKIQSLEIKVKSLERTKVVTQKWGMKLVLPIFLLLAGSVIESDAPKIFKMLVGLLGG